MIVQALAIVSIGIEYVTGLGVTVAPVTTVQLYVLLAKASIKFEVTVMPVAPKLTAPDALIAPTVLALVITNAVDPVLV